jgi:hypothetical protein
VSPNDKQRALYCSLNGVGQIQSRNSYRHGHVKCMQGKSPLVRHKCGWKDNIIMDLKEMRWERVD